MKVAGGRGSVTGVSVGATELVAVVGTHTVRVPVPGGTAAAAPDALVAAFQRLREGVAAPPGAAAVLALLPPLVDARLVTLPPLGRAEAEGVLRRDPRRYFLNGEEPRVVGAGERPRGRGPLLAAAARVGLVDALSQATARAGWRVQGVGAAHGAWIAAAKAGGAHSVVAVVGDAAHVVGLADGRASALRRVPVSGAADALASMDGPVLLLGADAGLRHALGAATHVLAATGASTDPAEVAAAHARQAGPALVTALAAAARAQRTRRQAALLAVAAVVLLLGAALLELWGTGRELAAVQARRARVSAEVAPLLVLRDSIDRLQERAAAVQEAAAAVPAWTPMLLDVALLLPEDAHVTALRTQGDTVVVDAVAARAGAAMQALRDAGTLRDVRLRGVVDREMREGSTAMERFTFTAQVVPPGTPGGAP